MTFDDMPIGGSKPVAGGFASEMDEQPIGGMKKGGYNLDDLGDEAFGGPPPGSKGDGFMVETKPKKLPPARLT